MYNHNSHILAIVRTLAAHSIDFNLTTSFIPAKLKSIQAHMMIRNEPQKCNRNFRNAVLSAVEYMINVQKKY